MIEVRNVSKSYDGRVVLHPTSYKFADGQTTVILGQSGSGKSTLLRILIGLVWPDHGQVFVDDVELRPEGLLAIRQRIGYMIQDGGLFPHLTAIDNILLLPRFLRVEERAKKTLNTLLRLTRLSSDLLERFPAQLSGGQRQRVSLIRALIMRPTKLLLDEPLGALDPMIRADLQTDLKEIFKVLGVTVILVTHDLAEAYFLGDEIAIMRDGHVVQSGSFDQLVNFPSEDYVSRFINAQRLIPTDEVR